MSFLFATEAELGYDPKVILDENKLQYTYEIPKSDVDGSRFYRTIKPISEYCSDNITGRMTRVWLTCEVASAICPTPIGPECILKDVWLDTSAKTERELQNAIFSDVQKAFEPDAESVLENQHMKGIKKRHAGIVASEAYKKYFLNILVDYKGEMSKEVSPADTRKAGLFGSREPQFDSAQHTRCSDLSKFPPSSKSPSLGVPRRAYVSKRQYRVIYEEVCTTVADLNTVGEVVDVLRHTLIRESSAHQSPLFKEINAYIRNFSASIDVLCWLGP